MSTVSTELGNPEGFRGGGRAVARLSLGLLYPGRMPVDLMSLHEQLDGVFNVLPATTHIQRPIAAAGIIEACVGLLVMIGSQPGQPLAEVAGTIQETVQRMTNQHYDAMERAVARAHEFGMPVFGMHVPDFLAPENGLAKAGAIDYADRIDPGAMQPPMEAYLTRQTAMRIQGEQR